MPKVDHSAAAKRVKLVFDKSGDVIKAFDVLTSRRVLAGVPAVKAPRSGDEHEGPINNAALMYIHEHGAPEVNIPARPVVHPAINSIKKELIAEQKRGAKLVLKGNFAAIDRMFHRMGIMAQNAMRKRITDGPFEPLAPRTIAERRARGRFGIKPLIDTGQLRRALTYVIRITRGINWAKRLPLNWGSREITKK